MVAPAHLEALQNISLFQDLTAEQIAQIGPLLSRKRFPTGTVLLTADQPGELAYIIYRGTVKICFEDTDGRETILAILGAGEIVGEMSLVDSLGRSATVITQEESVLFWMNRAAFWDCLKSLPPMTYALARILSRRMRMADAQIRSLVTQDVSGRILRQLLTFAHEYGQVHPDGSVTIPFRLTQSDIAGLVGASRPRVNAAFAFWKQRKLVSVDRTYRITLLDSKALTKLCGNL